MLNFINKLDLNSSEIKAIESLLEDQEHHSLLFKIMGQKLIENETIILEDPIGQLMSLTSTAPFASSYEECISVAKTINWGLRTMDVLPLVSEHKDKDLANRCLVSLSFFYRAMEERTKRHGCPEPKFYREIGASTYLKIGMDDIGNHFYKWESFLQEFFA